MAVADLSVAHLWCQSAIPSHPKEPGFRCGDCKGQLDSHSFTVTFMFTENSLSCLRSQLETSQALWHGCIVPPEVTQVQCGHKRTDKWWQWCRRLKENTYTYRHKQKKIILNTGPGRKGRWINYKTEDTKLFSCCMWRHKALSSYYCWYWCIIGD